MRRLSPKCSGLFMAIKHCSPEKSSIDSDRRERDMRLERGIIKNSMEERNVRRLKVQRSTEII
jgi:hypothetical protein